MANRFWVLSNEDARAPRFRQLHVEQNGGSWSFNSNLGWTWTNEEETVAPKVNVHSNEEPKKKSLFKRSAKDKK
jgi:hypothetical protein